MITDLITPAKLAELDGKISALSKQLAAIAKKVGA